MTELAAMTTPPDTATEVARYLQHLGISEPRLDVLNAGCHNQVYLCENAQPAFPDKVVVRVPKCPEASHSIEANATYLENTPAPGVLHVGTLALSGAPVVVEEYVAGSPKDLHTLTNREIYSLAATVAGVHQRTSSCFSGTSGGAPNCSGSYADYLEAMVAESVIDRLQNVDMTQHTEAAEAIAVGMQQLRHMITSQPGWFDAGDFSLLHHDLNPDNMLWTADGSVRLIDWNTTFGDAADDLDYLITNNQLTPAFKATFFEAYCAAAGQSDTVARAPAYTLKNQLDDLVWIIDMQQRFPDDTRYDDAAYQRRLSALRDTLENNPTANLLLRRHESADCLYNQQPQ